jgi:ABC-2 type transport system permease protein
MKKTVLILRHEVLGALRSKSFLFFAFLVPLLATLVFFGVTYLQSRDAEESGGAGSSPDEPELQVEGFVDEAGLIVGIPADLPADILVRYPDETSAQAALEAGEIDAYYVVPADYVEQGELIYVYPGYRPASSEGQPWVMKWALFTNLLGNDPELVAQASEPMELEEVPLAPEDVGKLKEGPLKFFVPYITMIIFYVVILMSASLLLESVNNEKKNRVMEILLVSVTPQQMLTGKIIGLGLLGLLQTAIWMGTTFTLLTIAGRTPELPAGFELEPAIVVWGIVFFLLGYALYASLMAALGALVPNLRESSQAVIVVIWPLILPMLLIALFIESPNGLVPVLLSLFPLTSPVAMMTRLAAVSVPWWQLLVTVVLLVATVVLIVRGVAGMFRAQTLLSGQTFSARRFYRALAGRL